MRKGDNDEETSQHHRYRSFRPKADMAMSQFPAAAFF
jgi:hypothetical protein